MIPAGTAPRARAARRAVAAVLALAYAVALAHALAVRAAGGLSRVPLFVFGTVQWTPALVVLLARPGFRGRLAALLRWPRDRRSLVIAWTSAAGALAACLALAWAAGGWEVPYAEAIARYPLRRFVPEWVLAPRPFAVYVVLVAPLLHLVNALAEEVLWRGWLLDEMLAAWPRRKAAWLNGVAWGLWHAPMILLLGWDFPEWRVAGVLSLTVSQVAWTRVLVELRLRSGSLWPAVVAHAVANALTIGLYDRLVDHRLNLLLSPWGLAGGAFMAAVAAALARRPRPRAARAPASLPRPARAS